MCYRDTLLKPLKPKIFIIWPLKIKFSSPCKEPVSVPNDFFLVVPFWKSKAREWKWFPWWPGLEVGVLEEVICPETVVEGGVDGDLWMAEQRRSVEPRKSTVKRRGMLSGAGTATPTSTRASQRESLRRGILGGVRNTGTRAFALNATYL